MGLKLHTVFYGLPHRYVLSDLKTSSSLMPPIYIRSPKRFAEIDQWENQLV
jgi:hypothetical protein